MVDEGNFHSNLSQCAAEGPALLPVPLSRFQRRALPGRLPVIRRSAPFAGKKYDSVLPPNALCRSVKISRLKINSSAALEDIPAILDRIVMVRTRCPDRNPVATRHQVQKIKRYIDVALAGGNDRKLISGVCRTDGSNR